LVAPESATQSVTSVGGVDAVELRQPARDYGSHSLNHDVEGSNCCGRGRVNKGPTLLHGKAILECHEEGMRRRLVRGSAHGWVKGGQPSELHQKTILGCREEGVRHRPLPGSAHGRVEGRPGGGASDGACGGANGDDSVQGPVGVLTPAERNRRPVRGWPAMVLAAMPAGAPTAATTDKELVTPMAVPARAPAAAIAPMALSREAAVVA
jgi:hypothetical protein